MILAKHQVKGVARRIPAGVAGGMERLMLCQWCRPGGALPPHCAALQPHTERPARTGQMCITSRLTCYMQWPAFAQEPGASLVVVARGSIGVTVQWLLASPEHAAMNE